MIIKIVKHALDNSIGKIARVRKETEKESIVSAGKKLEEFSAEWFSGEAPTLSYQDPLSRWAYCFAQVPANACLISEVIFRFCIANNEFLSSTLESEHVSFCAIGGGPGTELLGISKFYAKHARFGQGTEVEIKILDREPGWQENLVSLRAGLRVELKHIYEERKNYPFHPSYIFSLVNTGDENSYAHYADVISADIVICSQFISEIYDFDKLMTLIDAMREASIDKPYYLLIIDRQDQETADKMHRFIDLVGGNLLHEITSQKMMDFDEQISELDTYISQTNRKPRIKWYAKGLLAKIG